LSGKRGTKTVKKEVKQKHVLNDYMMNLYEKYKFENPGIKMSRTCFYKLRPSHVILADFANRRTCLCTRHQTMSLKIVLLSDLLRNCSISALYRKDINFTFLFILANFNFLRPIPVVLLIDEMHLYSEIEPDKIIGSLVLFFFIRFGVIPRHCRNGSSG
jgi:hypothetical protein